MNVPYLDLTIQYKAMQQELEDKVIEVMRSGQYILGKEMLACEEALAKFTGTKHCLSVASGTDALIMALMALDIGPGDEVITTPFSFFATVEAIILVGAKPVFVDIDPVTYNIQEDKIAAAITTKTKGILPVSLYGQMPNMEKIMEIAEDNNIKVIEDGAQSFGAKFKQGRSCSIAHVSTTSFFPAKPLGCAGDGGAVFTNSDSLAEALDQIRVHGQSGRYHHTRIGINGRLDAIQCAVISIKLKRYPQEIQMRQKIARKYSESLNGLPGIQIPKLAENRDSVWAQYTLAVDKREQFIADLKEQDVPSSIHYPKGLHRQPAVDKFVAPGDFPITDEMAERVVSIPLYADMPEEHTAYVIKKITEWAL